MSEFHALPIALRLLNSKVFEEKVKPFLKPIDLYVNYDSENIITEVSIFYSATTVSLCPYCNCFVFAEHLC